MSSVISELAGAIPAVGTSKTILQMLLQIASSSGGEAILDRIFSEGNITVQGVVASILALPLPQDPK